MISSDCCSVLFISFATITLQSVLPLLQPHLLSQDSLLRKSALCILAVLQPSSLVIKRSLEVEETPLTVKDARERCLRIGKVARAVVALGTGGGKGQDGELLKAEADVGIRSLVG